MTIIEKINAEIERRLKVTEPYKNSDDSILCARQELFWLREFINKLKRPEMPINSDELEEEIMRYTREDYDRDTTVRDVARHFYKLGKNAK